MTNNIVNLTATTKELELGYGFNRDSKEDDSVLCRCCGIAYIRGLWDFHHLCPSCFAQYDKQKMLGRYYKIGISKQKPEYYFENSDEWIASKLCKHSKM